MAQADGGHRPVLLAEVLDALRVVRDGFYVDATYGRGGHSAAILERLGPTGRLLAFDKDPEACAHARERFADDPRFEIRRGSFTGIARLPEAGVNGACFDLGVSSPQLEDAARGFSFLHDGPLDMRLDPTTGTSAAEWINAASEREIERVLREYGEERQAAKVAAKIANLISGGHPLQTTRELASLVASASGRGFRGKDPATRTFLAIRLYVNRELEELSEALVAAVARLRRGGRLVVISFHSLEDRIVKRFIRDGATPRRSRLTGRTLPDGEATLRKVGKPLRAGADEVAINPRARSALLRVAEKT